MAGHVACIGKKRIAHRFWWQNKKVRAKYEDLDI
jgi:hypothetical protein